MFGKSAWPRFPKYVYNSVRFTSIVYMLSLLDRPEDTHVSFGEKSEVVLKYFNVPLRQVRDLMIHSFS